MIIEDSIEDSSVQDEPTQETPERRAFDIDKLVIEDIFNEIEKASQNLTNENDIIKTAVAAVEEKRNSVPEAPAIKKDAPAPAPTPAPAPVESAKKETAIKNESVAIAVEPVQEKAPERPVSRREEKRFERNRRKNAKAPVAAEKQPDIVIHEEDITPTAKDVLAEEEATIEKLRAEKEKLEKVIAQKTAYQTEAPQKPEVEEPKDDGEEAVYFTLNF